MDLTVDRELAALNFLLGLPPLLLIVCHGYANCCACDECVERQRLSNGERREIVQPWEIEKAAA